MIKINAVAVLLLSISISAVAQMSPVGTFYCRIYDRQLGVAANLDGKGKIEHVIIEVVSNVPNGLFITFDDEQSLEEFHHIMEQSYDKYLEWRKVSKDNNVSEISKSMPFIIHELDFVWQYMGGRNTGTCKDVIPAFVKNSEYGSIFVIGGLVGGFVQNEWMIPFYSPQEAADFLKLTDPDYIKTTLYKNKTTKDLFQ